MVSPRDAELRGSQVSLRHKEAYRVMRALIDRGVIGDFRTPDVMRFGFTPLYLSYADVFEAGRRFKAVMDEGRWRDPRHSVRRAVT